MKSRNAPPQVLLLAYQLPDHPSRYRVNVWRRLQRAGAKAVHRALFTLEDTSLNRLIALDLAHDVENWGGSAWMYLGRSLEPAAAPQEKSLAPTRGRTSRGGSRKGSPIKVDMLEKR